MCPLWRLSTSRTSLEQTELILTNIPWQAQGSQCWNFFACCNFGSRTYTGHSQVCICRSLWQGKVDPVKRSAGVLGRWLYWYASYWTAMGKRKLLTPSIQWSAACNNIALAFSDTILILLFCNPFLMMYIESTKLNLLVALMYMTLKGICFKCSIVCKIWLDSYPMWTS